MYAFDVLSRTPRSRETARRALYLILCVSLLVSLLAPAAASAASTTGNANGYALTTPVLQNEPEITPGLQNKVAWSTPQVVDYYQLECSTDEFFRPDTIVGSVKLPYPTRQYAFADLTAGVSYFYRVRSKSHSLMSKWSNLVFSVQFDPSAHYPVAVAGPEYETFVGMPLTLDASLSHDPDGTIVKYEWGFDLDTDGSALSDDYNPGDIKWVYSSTTPTQVHTFTVSGGYVVYLRVTDNSGYTSIDRTYLKVHDDTQAPTAVLSAPLTAVAGQSITFDASGSFDLQGPIASYSWDFQSDNLYDLVTTSPTADWSWDVPGEWVVTVDVRDVAGNVGTAKATVIVTPVLDVAPDIPRDVVGIDRASDDGGATVLSWSLGSEPDLEGYRVYRAPSVDGPYVQIADVGFRTSYTDADASDGTTYWYTVTAYDEAAHESLFSAPTSAVSADNLAPAVPAGLTLADVAGDEGTALLATWNANGEGDLAGYTLTVTGPTGDTKVVDLPASATSYTIDGVTAQAVYRVSLSAYDEVPNRSDLSAEVAGSPIDNNAPSAPKGLIASVPDDGESVGLSWTPNAEADLAEYSIWRADGTSGDYTRLGTTTSTSFVDHAVTFGANYTYLVKATDTHGNTSDPSDAIAALPLDHVAPAAPAAPAVTDIAPDQGGAVAASWPANAEQDIAGYRVVYFDAIGTIVAMHDVGNVTADSCSGIPVGDVSAEVVAYDTHGNESAPSLRVTGTASDELAPAALAVSAADHVGDNGGAIDVAWAAAAEADFDHYTVYRASASDGPWNVVADNLSGTAFTDESADIGTTYYYAVTASDSHGNESLKATASAASADDLAPVVPAGLTAAPAAIGKTIDLSWSAVSDAAGYKLYRDGVEIADQTATTFTDSGLANGTAFTYAVAAYDAAGNLSAKADGVSATPADTTPPSAPSNLSVADVAGDNGGAVALSWDAVSDAVHYMVYRDGVLLATELDDPMFADSDAGTSVAHSYSVTAMDAAGNESARSGSAEGTALDNLAPASPSAAAAADHLRDNGGAIDVGWSGVYDAESYRVYRNGTLLVSDLGVCTYTDLSAITGTTYTYTVTAIDAAGNESDPSNAASAASADDLAPAVPDGLSVTADARGGAVALSWSEVSGAAGYKLYRDGVEIADQTSTTFADDGLVNGTTYHYTVAAYDNAGNLSAVSAAVSGTPGDSTPPNAPAGLVAMDRLGDEGSAIDLAWTAVSDAIEYNVYRNGLPLVLGVTSPPYGDETVLAGMAYEYAVTAVDAAGNESDLSAPASCVAADNLPPAAPTGVVAVDHAADNGGSIDISWSAVDGAASYAVYRDGVGLTSALVGTSYTDNTAVTGTSHTYTVSAFDGAGNESAASAGAVAASADNLAPAVPTGLTAADVPNDGGGAIALSWHAVSEAASYTVYRNGARLASGITAETYTDHSATNGTEYSYTVTASDAAGNESAPSSAATATSADNTAVPLAPPTNVLAQDNPRDYGNAIRVGWVAANDARVATYRVYRATTLAGPYARVTQVSGTTYLDSGLTAGTNYFYYVRSVDADGNESGNSNSAATSPVDNSIATTTRQENTGSDVAFTSGWWLVNTGAYATYASGGSLNYATSGTTAVANVSACTFTFTGSQVSWVGLKAPNRGIAAVYIDDVFRANVDCFDPVSTWQAKVFTSPVLIYGQHTIKVVYTGTKNAAATGNNAIDVDAFDVTVIPEFQAPLAPVSVAVTPKPLPTGGEIGLAWAANTEADLAGYKVYRSQSQDGPFAEIASLGKVTTFADTGRTNGTSYYYRITAIDTYGNESAPSAIKSAATFVAPTGVAVADHPADEGTSLDIRWNASPEPCVAGYELYRSDAADGVYMRVAKLGAVTSWTDPNVPKNSMRYYRVRAVDSADNPSAQSAEAGARAIDDLGPAAPTTTVRDVPYTGGELGLVWDANTSADLVGYRVYRSTAQGGPFELVKTLAKTATTFVDSGLTDGTIYYYKLAAYDTSNNESPGLVTISAAPSSATSRSIRYENNDPLIVYTAGWWLVNSGAYGTQTSGGSLDYATSGTNAIPNVSSCSLTFTGSYATWIGMKAFNRGIAAVYIDGVFQCNVDCYDPSIIWQAPVYTTPLLTRGEHTLKIVYTGSANAAASGSAYSVDVDAIDVVY